MKTPKFIFFDLGNVLLFFEHQLASQQMAAVSNRGEEEVRQFVFESGLQWKYESGDVSSEEFHQMFCQHFDCQPEFDQLLVAASDIFTLNESILPIVNGLKKSEIPIAVLSNTCDAHWRFVTNGQYPVLDRSFDQAILSFEVNSMKPDPEIYQAAIEMAGVAANEIFFVDDKSENVAGAIEAGIDAVLFTDSEKLSADLKLRGLNF